jgi:hypothetical protein
MIFSMTLQTHHTILKHYLDLDLKTGNEDMGILPEVEMLVKEKIQSPMESIFDEFCSHDSVIQFDRIYLDLGTIDANKLKDELASAYCRALRRFFEQESLYGKHFSVKQSSAFDEVISAGRRISSDKKIQEDILHFFQFGYWPALSSYPSKNFDQLLSEQFEHDTSFANHVLEMLRRDARVATRVALQSTPATLNAIQKKWKESVTLPEKANYHLLIHLLSRLSIGEEVIKRIIPLQIIRISEVLSKSLKLVEWLQRIGIPVSQLFYRELGELFKSGYFINNVADNDLVAFWTEVFALLSPGQHKNIDELSNESLKNQHEQLHDNDISNKAETIDPKIENEAISPEWKNRMEQSIINTQAGNDEHIADLSTEKLLSFHKLIADQINLDTENDLSLPTFLPDKSFFISNAGLILLHPFLPQFFTTLGLVENDTFIDSYSTERAIHLLQYLATGSEDFFEAALVFNKILCGWPIEMPVSRYIELTDMEKNECDAMLQAVVAHWTVLKNSSPQALQESFLSRMGKLVDNAGIWELKVASSGVDILLSEIPWSISVIKLPWMSGHIIVDWN